MFGTARNIFVMMITFILWIDCRQAESQQRQREGLIDKSIEFKASVQVHCLGRLQSVPQKV